MAKTLTIIGKVWLFIACALILLGYASILYNEGWQQLAEILSPLNFWNYIAVAITLAPGLVLMFWGERIAERRRRGESDRSDQTN